MRVDIYSDTVCPWCFLGKRRLELALAARPQYEVQLRWRPFELNPEVPVEGLEAAVFNAAKAVDLQRTAQVHAELKPLGEASGIEFRFDLIRRVPNTRRSHLLIALAGRSGIQAAVTDRIMRAYFEEGCDIGDPDELVRLGTEAGLAERAARNALILRAGQDGVVAAERHAQVLGITGVPSFIFDGTYTISGAQEVQIFARVFDQVAEFAATKSAAQ